MAGSVEGGRKAAKTNLKLHGKDFYRIIGSKGGQAGHTGGFAASAERARWAGQLGGKTSRVGRRYLGTKRGKRIYENLSTGEIERIAV